MPRKVLATFLTLCWCSAAASALPPTGVEKKLQQEVTFEFDQGPLKDALAFLSERYGIEISVDEQAFRDVVQIQDVVNQPVKVGKTKASLSKVLKKVLGQVQGTYEIRQGAVVGVPKKS